MILNINSQKRYQLVYTLLGILLNSGGIPVILQRRRRPTSCWNNIIFRSMQEVGPRFRWKSPGFSQNIEVFLTMYITSFNGWQLFCELTFKIMSSYFLFYGFLLFFFFQKKIFLFYLTSSIFQVFFSRAIVSCFMKYYSPISFVFHKMFSIKH